MPYKFGTVSHGTTGIKTITCGFAPLMWEFCVELAPGASYNAVERSVGVGDGTNQNCTQEYSDPSRCQVERYTDRLAELKTWNSGTSVYDTKVRTTFSSTTATELKHNVTVADSNFQIRFKIWG